MYQLQDPPTQCMFTGLLFLLFQLCFVEYISIQIVYLNLKQYFVTKGIITVTILSTSNRIPNRGQ